MTMMATTEPAMSRLFSRIDSLPRPRDDDLARLFRTWQNARGEGISPKTADSIAARSFAESPGGFIFSALPHPKRGYKLEAGASALVPLLGTLMPAELLAKAPDRRGAVRCRRLFDWVLKTGEPVLVEFVSHQPLHEPLACEMIALPLLRDDGRTPGGVFGGLACRPLADGTRRRASEHLLAPAPLFFAFERDRPFAELLVKQLGASLSPLEEREFEDGEHKIRPLVDVAGRETYVIASLNAGRSQSVNDRLCRLLFFIGALKTGGAARVTAATPYLCYMRKDRRTKPHDPLTARYVAQLFEAVGADELLVLEAHNPAALENAFRIPVVHLDAYDAFAAFFTGELDKQPVVVVSPDLGAGKRADGFRSALEHRLGYPVGKAFMEKQRSQGLVTGELFAGDVSGKVAILFDDMICSGTTMARAADECRRRGATRVYLAATHGLFTSNAAKILAQDPLTGVCVTNSVTGEVHIPHLQTLDVSSVFANALKTRLGGADRRSGRRSR